MRKYRTQLGKRDSKEIPNQPIPRRWTGLLQFQIAAEMAVSLTLSEGLRSTVDCLRQRGNITTILVRGGDTSLLV